MSKRRGRVQAISWLWLTFLLLPACHSPAPAASNVILISIDTLRARNLGCYGYASPTSPFIDSLARQGVRFANAQAQSSWTLPSHMSLMTSRYPHSHQVETDQQTLDPSIATLAEVLQKNGYSTNAFVSWVYVSAKFGFDHGFDQFRELVPPPRLQDASTHHAIKAAELVDEVAQWIPTRSSRPFFLFLHLFDPHISYEPPLKHARLFDPTVQNTAHGSYKALKPYIRGLTPDALRPEIEQRRRVTALYDGEIRYTDTQLERLFGLLDREGMLENTLVVLTSDHGEELGEHGSMEGHQWTLYQETTEIPLIMKFPGGAHAETTLADLVQSIDVAPTILDYLGLATPSGFQGRSLLPLVEGGSLPPQPAFASTKRFNHKWSLRTGRHKLIFTLGTGVNIFGVQGNSGYELYDLEHDPLEQKRLDDLDSAEARALKKTLQDWARSAPAKGPQEAPQLTPEEQERLEALGYVH